MCSKVPNTESNFFIIKWFWYIGNFVMEVPKTGWISALFLFGKFLKLSKRQQIEYTPQVFRTLIQKFVTGLQKKKKVNKITQYCPKQKYKYINTLQTYTQSI